jgi:hypothetical protein
MAWKHASMEAYTSDHSDEWGLAFSKLYRHFYDDGGDMESGEF